jgi:hypothetical protein
MSGLLERPRLAFKRFCVDCNAHDADALKLAAAPPANG